MSTNPKKIQSGKNDKFNVEIGDKTSDDKQIFDLNEIFHIDLSYNFDLLKNLLSTIIKNQKLKDDKITELENQILDLRIAYNEGLTQKSGEIFPKKMFEEKDSKSKSIITSQEKKEEEKDENKEEDNLEYELKPPKKGPELEISEQNPPIINKIIVSKNKNKFYNFNKIIFIGKNSWNG